MKTYQLALLIILLGSCKQDAHTQASSRNNIVDLGSYKTEQVNLDSIYTGRPFLHEIGAQDTFRIDENVTSARVALYKVKAWESEAYLGKLEIQSNGKVAFIKTVSSTSACTIFRRVRRCLRSRSS
jgi:hypothetical protein